MTPRDLLTVVTAPWREDEPPARWILRVTADHRVIAECDGVVAATMHRTSHESAMAYARASALAMKARVIDETSDCGGCGPRPSANRCAWCKRMDVLEDRASDERAWA